MKAFIFTGQGNEYSQMAKELYENNLFAKELIDQYSDEIKQEAWSCPWCGGRLKKISGPYGEFYGCSNYQTLGCKYRRKINRT